MKYKLQNINVNFTILIVILRDNFVVFVKLEDITICFHSCIGYSSYKKRKERTWKKEGRKKDRKKEIKKEIKKEKKLKVLGRATID